MVTTRRATTTIVYPDSDGFPLPDGRFQEPLYLRAVGTLRTFFKDTPNTEVSGNTFIYYEEDNPRLKLAPDCQIVFGLTDEAVESLRHRNTYLTWEVGKPPDFVLEIASPSTAYVDQHRKRDLYAGMGVPEYWRYDSLGGRLYDEPLVGERLVGGEYERMDMHRESDGSVWGHSDALNLDLWWIDGELRFWNPARGVWLRDFEETEEALRAAEARANAERDARLAEACARGRRARRTPCGDCAGGCGGCTCGRGGCAGGCGRCAVGAAQGGTASSARRIARRALGIRPPPALSWQCRRPIRRLRQ